MVSKDEKSIFSMRKFYAMNAPETQLPKIRLTEFSHGGGCGCKIAPAVLAEILASSGKSGGLMGVLPKDLLVGTETADDAAVYRLNDSQALVATTDFFTPIVDDPFDFGRIAATNAISDVYAMGGKPIMALAIVGMPLDKLPTSVIRAILSGGESVCAAAGIPLAGGHSIDVLEPIYGLVALGLVHPGKVKRNSSAKPGDILILGKPLGVGILSAALKKGKLSAAGYAQMVELTTKLNTPGEALAEMPDVHALTDVTGFGLAGHLLEICRGSKLSAEVAFEELPILAEARTWAQQGVATGASERNWKGYGAEVSLPNGFEEWQRKLLSDPQTSGGLLVACAPHAVRQVLEEFEQRGFGEAKTIGRLSKGPARLTVT
jgi:selenide,water dikinase